MVVDYWTIEDYALRDRGYHLVRETLYLYDANRSCADLQEAYGTWGEASARLIAAAEAGTYCEAVPEYFDRLAAQDAGEPDALHRLRVQTCSGTTEECGGRLTEATIYPIGEATFVELLYSDDPDDSWVRARDAWDAFACSMAPGFWDDEEELLHWYDVPAGDFLVTKVAPDGSASGELLGDLVDENEELLGTIEATFDAEPCAWPEVEALVY